MGISNTNVAQSAAAKFWRSPVPYAAFKNGLMSLPPEDFMFSDIEPDNGSPGFATAEMGDGTLQQRVLEAVQGLMQAEATLPEILGALAEDRLKNTSTPPSLIYAKSGGYFPKNPSEYEAESLGVNLAIALTIPSKNYSSLQNYVDSLLNHAAGTAVKSGYSSCIEGLRGFNQINHYKILRIIPDSSWDIQVPAEHLRRDFLKLAIAGDDCAMVDRIGRLFKDYENFDLEVGKALASTQYDAMSQVRHEHSFDKEILMTEVSERVFNQISALESPNVLVRTHMGHVVNDDQPAFGYMNTHVMGVPIVNQGLRHLPRFDEYMSGHAVYVMNNLCVTLDRSRTPACSERKAVVSLLLQELVNHGISFKEIVLKGFNRLSPAEYEDVLDQTGGAYMASIRSLLSARNHADYPLRKFAMAEMIRSVPLDDVLMAARHDADLKTAYEFTGSKLFLDRMTPRGVESALASDLGL